MLRNPGTESGGATVPSPFAWREPPLILYLSISLLLHGLVLLWVEQGGPARGFFAVPEKVRQRPSEPVLTFVPTSPEQAVEESPQDARTYSDHATAAAQPEPSPADSPEKIPEIDGEDSRTIALETGSPDAGAPPAPAAPAPPVPVQETTPSPAEAAQAASRESPAENRPAGDRGELVSEPLDSPGVKLAAEPLPRPPAEPLTAQEPPSETSVEAQGRGRPGPHTRLPQVAGRVAEATVSRRGTLSHDTMKSAFGAYDQELFERIGNRWIALVRPYFYGERSGEVVVRFVVGLDGDLLDLEVVEETSGEALSGFCLKAVRDSSPFPPMPGEVVKATNFDRREYRIRFLY